MWCAWAQYRWGCGALFALWNASLLCAFSWCVELYSNLLGGCRSTIETINQPCRADILELLLVGCGTLARFLDDDSCCPWNSSWNDHSLKYPSRHRQMRLERSWHIYVDTTATLRFVGNGKVGTGLPGWIWMDPIETPVSQSKVRTAPSFPPAVIKRVPTNSMDSTHPPRQQRVKM